MLNSKYPELTFRHSKNMMLSDIIKGLAQEFPEYEPFFGNNLKTSFIKPDGGFLYAKDKSGNVFYLKKLVQI